MRSVRMLLAVDTRLSVAFSDLHLAFPAVINARELWKGLYEVVDGRMQTRGYQTRTLTM